MPDRTATTLLRLARDPRSGQLRRGSALDVGLRAALFTDLVFAGHVISASRAPSAVTDHGTGDRFLDILRDAVARRPAVSWPRWFRHVRSDRSALIDELVEQRRWQQQSAGLRPSFRDGEPEGILELGRHLRAVAAHHADPVDARDAALAALCKICGALDRPEPRAIRKDLQPLLATIGDPDDPVRGAIHAALGGASVTIRRSRWGKGIG
ncbi:MAG: GPP34 family phosphoprotein [Actinomycetota bacterium]